MLFSVGEGAGASDGDVVVVVVVEVDGPVLSPLEQATNADDIAAKTRMQAALRRRWFEFIFGSVVRPNVSGNTSQARSAFRAMPQQDYSIRSCGRVRQGGSVAPIVAGQGLSRTS
jgi:hypothetical protein